MKLIATTVLVALAIISSSPNMVLFEDGSGTLELGRQSVSFCLEGQYCDDGDGTAIPNITGWEWEG